MQNVPNLFLVGAPKCATSSLVDYLKQHPQIFFPSCKEPHYFSAKYLTFPHCGPGDVEYDQRIIRSEEKYFQLFKDANNFQAIGDGSTDYLYFSETASDIIKFNPNAKIIISLRNPVERAVSAYKHLVKKNRLINLSFEEVLAMEPESIRQNYRPMWYLKDMGLYYRQVSRYLDVFPRKQVKIILFDDVATNAYEVLNDIIDFLGLETPFPFDTAYRVNESIIVKNKIWGNFLNEKHFIKEWLKTFLPIEELSSFKLKLLMKSSRPMKVTVSPETQSYLLEFFRDDILALQNLIERDLTHWLTKTLD